MKTTLPIVAAASIVLLALTGCSGGGSGSTSGSATSAPKENGSSSSKTYAATDLVALLTKAEGTLGVTGTIKDNAQLEAELKGVSSSSVTGDLTKAGGKIEPAACGTALDNATPTTAKEFGLGSNGVGAELTYTKGILGLSTVAGGQLPSAVISRLTANLNSFYSACSDMKIVDGSTTVGMTITKLSLSTDADQTYAFDESIKLGATSSDTTSIEAVYGNLFIAMTGLGGTTKDAIAAVNAVVAAAKG